MPLREIPEARSGRSRLAEPEPIRGLSAGWLRVLFVLTGALAGLGIVVYLTCWLILPEEGEGVGAAEEPTVRGVVVLAQVCAGALALAGLAVLGAAATVFGFGWVVMGIAALLLAGVLAGWRRPRRRQLRVYGLRHPVEL